METTKKGVEDFIKIMEELTQSAIFKFESCNIEAQKNLMGNYFEIIYQRFQLLCGASCIYSNTDKGREIGRRNLECELSENHANMLRELAVSNNFFPRSSTNLPLIKDFEQIFLASKNPILTHGLLAVLERCSIIFLPSMKNALVRVNKNIDTTYFDIHGKADEQHASIHLDALIDEIDFYKLGEQDTNMLLFVIKNWYVLFLYECFTIDKNLD